MADRRLAGFLIDRAQIADILDSSMPRRACVTENSVRTLQDNLIGFAEPHLGLEARVRAGIIGIAILRCAP